MPPARRAWWQARLPPLHARETGLGWGLGRAQTRARAQGHGWPQGPGLQPALGSASALALRVLPSARPP
eukprot:1377863-Pleurochrysis_carterae.AAC.1